MAGCSLGLCIVGLTSTRGIITMQVLQPQCLASLLTMFSLLHSHSCVRFVQSAILTIPSLSNSFVVVVVLVVDVAC